MAQIHTVSNIYTVQETYNEVFEKMNASSLDFQDVFFEFTGVNGEPLSIAGSMIVAVEK